MATQNLGKTISLPAGESFASKQYHFAKVNSSGQAVVAGDGENAIGVIQDDVASGEASCIAVGDGVTKVVAGAAATAGNSVGSNSAGRAVEPGTGDRILGVFLESPTADGQVVSILLKPTGATA